MSDLYDDKLLFQLAHSLGREIMSDFSEQHAEYMNLVNPNRVDLENDTIYQKARNLADKIRLYRWYLVLFALKSGALTGQPGYTERDVMRIIEEQRLRIGQTIFTGIKIVED